MISTSQKEHLTYSLILQFSMLIGLIMVVFLYILPGIEEINANADSAVNTVEQFKKLKEDGLNLEELKRELSNIRGKEELLKIIGISPEETRTAITKTEKGDYKDWLDRSIGESSKDRNDLKVVKMLINSTLPTLNPTSNNIDEEYMTLKSYIKFIEKKFLSEYNIDSNIVLGLQGINYGIDQEAKNIGNFELQLDFRATNEDVQKLIDYINKSGDPSLLSGSGLIVGSDDTDDILKEKVVQYLNSLRTNTDTKNKINDKSTLLANPLMTIQSLSLENLLDRDQPKALNSGRVTIRFYVRGSTEEDIKFLQNALLARRDDFKKEISKAVTECKSQEFCTDLKKIEAFEIKYNAFSASLDKSEGFKNGNMAILGQISDSLRTLDEEFKKIIKNKRN